MRKTYKSRFGYSLLVFITLIFGIILAIMFFQNEPLEGLLSLSSIFLMIYALFIYINLSTKYTIDGSILIIKCGVLYHKRLQIHTIKAIRKTGNLISAPAPSLDRIALTYNKFGSLVLSPKDKIGFANDLVKVNPSIQNNLVETD